MSSFDTNIAYEDVEYTYATTDVSRTLVNKDKFVSAGWVGVIPAKANIFHHQNESKFIEFHNEFIEFHNEICCRLMELLHLPKGWDGPDSMPVKNEIAESALRVLCHIYQDQLPIPSLVPGADGSLQIEWHCGDYDIELDILEPNLIDAWRKNIKTDVEDEDEISTTDFKDVGTWMHQLVLSLPLK